MILITGASGLIGRALAQHLLLLGQNVRLQGRSVESVRTAVAHRQIDLARAEIVALDFAKANSGDYFALTRGCDTIIHCGGLVHQPEAEEIQYKVLNVDATRMLAQAASARGSQTFMFLSTSAVYGNGPFEMASEDAPLEPRTAYASSKLSSEGWLQEAVSFSRLIILRPSLVFGEGDRGNMSSLMRQISKGQYVHIAGNKAKKSLIYSRNLAHAMALALARLPEGKHILNGTDAEPIPVIGLANALAYGLLKPAPHSVPLSLLQAAGFVGETLLGTKSPVTKDKISKLTTTTTCSARSLIEATGYEPMYSLEESIFAEIRWFMDSPAVGSDLIKQPADISSKVC